jgi:predicted phosphoribosyltransferase
MGLFTRQKVFDLMDLRGRTGIFFDRVEAGKILAGMFKIRPREDVILLAIPNGGIPVAVEVAKRLKVPLEVTPVSKITLPWNTEVGYGAVAWDETIVVDESAVASLGVSEKDRLAGIEAAKEKVRRRVEAFRNRAEIPSLAGRTAILVDDGLATGFTMSTAVDAATRLGAEKTIVAVPTGHGSAMAMLSGRVDVVYCPNIRHGLSYAVAEAYRNWRDVDDDEAAAILQNLSSGTYISERTCIPKPNARPNAIS